MDFQLRIIALHISFELFYGISPLNDSAHNNAMAFQLRVVL